MVGNLDTVPDNTGAKRSADHRVQTPLPKRACTATLPLAVLDTLPIETSREERAQTLEQTEESASCRNAATSTTTIASASPLLHSRSNSTREPVLSIDELKRSFLREKDIMLERITDLELSAHNNEHDSHATARAFAETMSSLEQRFRDVETDAKADTTMLKEYITRLETNVKLLEQTEKTQKTTIQRLKDKVSGLISDVHEQKNICSQAVADLQSTSEQVRLLNDQKSKLVQKLESTNVTCSKLSEDIESLKHQCSMRIQQKSKELRQSHDDEQTRRTQEIDKLKNSLIKQTAVIDEYRHAQREYKRSMKVLKTPDSLYVKNKVLCDRLEAIAKAGAFGSISDDYWKALQLLRGVPRAELHASKSQN